jgi:hypothetical protein
MADDSDPIFNASLNLPFNYAFTVGLRAATVKRTALMLAPWALYMVLPKGRVRGLAQAVASRISPLAQASIKPLD